MRGTAAFCFQCGCMVLRDLRLSAGVGSRLRLPPGWGAGGHHRPVLWCTRVGSLTITFCAGHFLTKEGPSTMHSAIVISYNLDTVEHMPRSEMPWSDNRSPHPSPANEVEHYILQGLYRGCVGFTDSIPIMVKRKSCQRSS